MTLKFKVTALFSLGLSHWKRFWLVCTARSATDIDTIQYNTIQYMTLHVPDLSQLLHAEATNFFCFWRFTDRVIHSNYCQMDDLEIQGRMILHMTLPISVSTHAIATIFGLFLVFYWSGNSFQLLPNAWPWLMTLKFKVTWFCKRSQISQLPYMLSQLR